jgi:hypothetical protein
MANAKLVAAVIFSVGLSCAIVIGTIEFCKAVYRSGVSSPTWPSAQGEIRASGLGQGCGRSRNNYYIEVAYAYVVNDQIQIGNRIAFETRFCGGKYAAESLVAKYKPGTPVYVYYDPSEPAQSSLARGRYRDSAYFGLLLLLPGILLIAWAPTLIAYQRKRGLTAVDSKTLRASQAALDNGIQIEIKERQNEIRRKLGSKRDA